MQLDVDSEDGWELLKIQARDDLKRVPASFSELLTPDICAVFRNPQKHFRQVAAQTPCRAMATWLTRMIDRGDWELHLFRWEIAGVAEAGFSWCYAPDSFSLTKLIENAFRTKVVDFPGDATIGLPTQCDLQRYPPQLQRYFSLVGEVRWNSPGNAGQIYGAEGISPIGKLSYYSGERDSAEATTTFSWGITEFGETFVFNQEGAAGWISSGGDLELTESVDEMLEKVYGALLRAKSFQREY